MTVGNIIIVLKELEFKNKQLQATLINLEVDNVKLRDKMFVYELLKRWGNRFLENMS